MTNTDASARPSLYDRLDKALDTPGARPWLTRWLVVSMVVLGTAGLFALPLAFGRAPGLSDMFPWFVDNFHRFLVVHVDYSFVVFYLCVFAGIANITVYRLSGVPLPRSSRHHPKYALSSGLLVYQSLPSLPPQQ